MAGEAKAATDAAGKAAKGVWNGFTKTVGFVWKNKGKLALAFAGSVLACGLAAPGMAAAIFTKAAATGAPTSLTGLATQGWDVSTGIIGAGAKPLGTLAANATAFGAGKAAAAAQTVSAKIAAATPTPGV